MPPRTKPQLRIPPPACSAAWSWSSTYAVPGRRGAGDRVVDRVPAERRLARARTRSARPGTASPRWRTGRARRDRAAVARRAVRASSAAPASSRGARRAGVGRRRVDQRPDQLGELGRARPRTPAAPARRRREKRPTSSWAAGDVVAEQCSRAPSGNRLSDGPGGVDLDAALDQPHVAPDRLAQHAEHVGAGRGAEAGRELLGDAGSRRRSRAARGPASAGRPRPGSRRRRGRCGPPPTITAS